MLLALAVSLESSPPTAITAPPPKSSDALAGSATALPPLPVDRPELAGTAPPPRGNTMFGFGVFGVSFGIANLTLGAWMMAWDLDGAGVIIGTGPLVFGATAVALGALGIHFGKRRRETYRDWQLANGQVPNWIVDKHFPDAPPTGLGMLISGSVGLAIGASVIPYGVPNLDSSTPQYRREGVSLVVFGSLALASGMPMLIAGSVRLHRRNRWHARLRETYMRPTSFLTPGGAGFGVAGRF